MPLTLEQYATYLDGRGTAWPAPAAVERPSARPHLKRLDGIKAVLWNTYGTLLCVTGGELCFELSDDLLMEVALEKTVTEFNMWGAMTRKPGQPGKYLGEMYKRVLFEQRCRTGGDGERYPEVASERIWEVILKKLLQKEYKFDTTFFGSLNEYSRKIAYFFHSSLQGCECYLEAARSLTWCHEHGLIQGLLGDGQCFTPVQLQRGLECQHTGFRLEDVIPQERWTLSHEVRGRKPSERLFKQALETLKGRDIEPRQVLHVGSRLQLDVAPARKLGMKTALFAGDKGSLQATQEELKGATTRPDVLLTRLGQIASVVPLQ